MKRVKKAPADAKKKIQEHDEIARLKRRVSELQEPEPCCSEQGERLLRPLPAHGVAEREEGDTESASAHRCEATTLNSGACQDAR